MEEKVGFKRKRKDSFLRKAKKYRKRGVRSRGHGTHIEDDVFQYFCRVLDVWNKGFDSEEDKLMFANNVLEQTKGSEMELCTSQLTSKAIETVMGAASDDAVKTLESPLRTDLRVAFVDTFCSHLTQKIILASARRIAEGETEDCDSSFAVVSIKFAINNIEEFAWHVCACHVVRSCLEAVSLIHGKVSSEYPQLFYEALIKSPILIDISTVELGSGLLQALLKCLHECDDKLCQKSISTLLKKVFCPQDSEDKKNDDDDEEDSDEKKEEKKGVMSSSLHKVFTTQPSIRLLEKAIECSTSKRYTQIYAFLFINKLRDLALNKPANMAVQALIRSAQDKTEFEGIFDELSESLKDVLIVGHTGVLHSLATTCRNLGARQGQFLHCMMRLLECSDSESELCSKLLSLKESSPDSISLHGSLILQSLLHFQKPIKVVNSLLSMDTEKLLKVLCDPRGCHISDAFFSGQFVGEKSREKLFHKLKDKLVELAVSKHGSRSFDAVWAGIGGKLRQVAIAKLSENESKVTNSECGRIIANKIHLGAYRRDPKAWASAVISNNNAQKLFSDIISAKA